MPSAGGWLRERVRAGRAGGSPEARGASRSTARALAPRRSRRAHHPCDACRAWHHPQMRRLRLAPRLPLRSPQACVQAAASVGSPTASGRTPLQTLRRSPREPPGGASPARLGLWRRRSWRRRASSRGSEWPRPARRHRPAAPARSRVRRRPSAAGRGRRPAWRTPADSTGGPRRPGGVEGKETSTRRQRGRRAEGRDYAPNAWGGFGRARQGGERVSAERQGVEAGGEGGGRGAKGGHPTHVASHPPAVAARQRLQLLQAAIHAPPPLCATRLRLYPCLTLLPRLLAARAFPGPTPGSVPPRLAAVHTIRTHHLLHALQGVLRAEHHAARRVPQVVHCLPNALPDLRRRRRRRRRQRASVRWGARGWAVVCSASATGPGPAAGQAAGQAEMHGQWRQRHGNRSTGEATGMATGRPQQAAKRTSSRCSSASRYLRTSAWGDSA